MAGDTVAELQLNKEADLILGKARKLSLGWGAPPPALCEELILQAFITLKHPLYHAIAQRFTINAHVLTSALYQAIRERRLDAPTAANLVYERQLLQLIQRTAQQSHEMAISERHIMQVLFQHEHPNNTVRLWFEARGIQPAHVLQCIIDYQGVEALPEPEQSSPAPTAITPKPTVTPTTTATKDDALTAYGRNLTQLARDNQLMPIHGREHEINAIQEVLARRHQNNPLLIGPPGVGKTAIIEGLAQQIVYGVTTHKRFKDLVLWQIDLGALIAGTSLRGQFEERLQTIITVCEQQPQVVVYFPEFHRLVGAGDHTKSTDAASLLKPALLKGHVRCIGTTTIADYHRTIAPDHTLDRSFQVVRVSEPAITATMDIVNHVKPQYEEYHHVTILPEAVEAAIEFSDRYIRDRVLPGKALTLLDQACARVSLGDDDTHTVTKTTIGEIVAQHAQIPLSQVLFSAEEIFQNLEERLKEHVIGQDHAIHAIAEVVQLTKYEMDLNPRRPDGVFLLAGPTGTGKTELAKALATCLLGSEDKLLRFDMSEFHERHTIAKLIGAPPGYEGSAEGGVLTNAVKANPYSVILFDEMEKAHKDLQRIFLQVFDDGRLTDAKGVTTSFCHATILMTTNLGARDLNQQAMTQQSGELMDAYIQRTMEPAVKAFFSPEFLNRLYGVFYFRPLAQEVVNRITHQKVDQVLERLQKKGLHITIDADVYAWLSARGHSMEYGARFLNRTIEEQMLNPLTKRMLAERMITSWHVALADHETLRFSGASDSTT